MLPQLQLQHPGGTVGQRDGGDAPLEQPVAHSWQLPICWDPDNGVPRFSPTLSWHAVVSCINLYSRVQIVKRVKQDNEDRLRENADQLPGMPTTAFLSQGVLVSHPNSLIASIGLVITTHNMQA